MATTTAAGERATVRPARAVAEPAVVALLERHGGRLMSVARRYSHCREDAEDAYQRAVEILLVRAPSVDVAALLPWMKTVVKHEAFAVTKQRARHGTPSEACEIEPHAGRAEASHEVAERRERLRLGAEALGRLKPHETRALLLRADGLSYREICAATGWTYTKVNRCLSEGRASFVDRVAGIERGAECERLAPLVSLAADGEASPDQVAALRPHLSGCLACRARLREYRRAPARAAAAVAPVGVVGFARWLVHGAAGHVQAAASLVPTAAAQKAAVVAAAVAVAGGGGLAVVHRSLGADPPRPRAAGRRFPSPQRAASPAVPRPAPAGAVARRRSGGQVRVGSRPRVVRERSPSRGSADHHVPSHRSAPPTTGEFTPTPAPSPQPRVTPPGQAHSPRPTPGPTGGEFAP